MIGHNHHAVLAMEKIRRELLAGHREMRIAPHRRQSRDKWVVVLHNCTAVQEKVHQFESRGLAGIVDIFFVGHAKKEDLASFERLGPVIEGVHDSFHHIGRHRGVDLSGELDEPGCHSVFSCDPGQVERVNWYAVASQAWAWEKSLKTERFGAGRIDDFPDINTHSIVQDLEFVDQPRSILANQVRHYIGTKSRDLRLERALADELDQSSRALDESLIATHSSPSQQAVRREQAVLLADALQGLPEDYREVIILRQLEGLSFPDVARRMGRTEDSVKNVWLRALARLRRMLEDPR